MVEETPAMGFWRGYLVLVALKLKEEIGECLKVIF
jgi:hypothetical protein